MCQGVVERMVPAALIQPVRGGVGPPMARPGRRTLNQNRPLSSWIWASIGSTVRAPVSGRLALTCATFLPRAAGLARTV